MSSVNFKYGEDKIVAELQEYLDSTYAGHYVAGGERIQTFDIWNALDVAGPVCQGTAIKYLMRYGRKAGFNKKDLLKAMHYIILLWHYTQEEQTDNDKDV